VRHRAALYTTGRRALGPPEPSLRISYTIGARVRTDATVASVLPLLTWLAAAPAVAPGAAPTAGGDGPGVLEASCVKCHNPSNSKGGLDLSTREGLLRGGDGGPAIVPGRPQESLLFRLVTHEDEPAMPRKADKLDEARLGVLRAWIAAGAPYQRPLAAREAAEVHWAFRPLPAFPPGTTIDGLVRARLRARGLAPNPPAGRRALVRRATFDLLGLPPAPEEVRAFERDRAPRAWERLVDRLLASPHHGERRARHWLDVARYADSDGYEADADRPQAFAYRDFVIRAFNADMPFDQFVRWQLAGDEVAPDEPEAWAATGFLAAGPQVVPNPTDTRENKEKYRYDELDDVVSTTAAAFLGLTVGCARCHDHKYDPITTRDYYGLVAAFVTTERATVSLDPAVRAWERWRAEERRLARERRMEALGILEDERDLLRVPLNRNNPTQSRIYKRWDDRLQVAEEELLRELDGDRQARWRALEAAARAAKRSEASRPRALVVTDAGPEPRPSFLLARGEPSRRLEPLGLGFPGVLTRGAAAEEYRRAALGAAPAGAEAARTTLRRAALAAWLTDVARGAGALVARVTANRIWQQHFGRGLVDTPNDFGTQTDAPVHAELLDFLAAELVRGGWRAKPLDRLIMTSAVYRQGSAPDERRRLRDPDGRLLSWRRLVRLEAEAVRDALLAVSGTLNRTMFGPAVKPAIPADAVATRSSDKYPTDTPDGPGVWRRSVYLFVKRSVRHPLMEVLDAPDASASCGRRAVTTVPTQALTLLNDPFVRARARDFAARVLGEVGPDPGRQVERAFRLALARPPTERERRDGLALLGARAAARARSGEALAPAHAHLGALADLCHALFTTNELVHVE
jgi:mono/diheme cytochrome c family protein